MAQRSSDIWEPQAWAKSPEVSVRAWLRAWPWWWPKVSPPRRRSELVCFISPLSGSVSVSPPSLALSFSLAFL